MEYTNPEYGVFRHEPFYCPHGCGYKMDATGEMNEENVPPTTGDVSICLRCGGFMEMSDVSEWVILSDETKRLLIAELPKEWIKLMSLQHAIQTEQL